MNPRYKNIAFLEFESYYDTKSGFSLAQMPTINYCRDPRFKSFGCSVGWNGEPLVYLTHEEFLEWAESFDCSTPAVCAHCCLIRRLCLDAALQHLPRVLYLYPGGVSGPAPDRLCLS